MIGKITKSSSLNSFSSICYCFTALGIHSFSSYRSVRWHQDANSKAWPGNGGTPSEAALLLGATIVSLLMLPFFCVTCFFKIGNYANDGVKLGRDHALISSMDIAPEINSKHENLRRVWRHFCPLSQTLHLVAAFLLLIPETLLTAVEIKFGYKSADAAWVSNLDFLFSPDRAMMSEIRSSVNLTQYTNATHVLLPTPRVPVQGWRDTVTVSTAFINFCFALACFVMRYSSVFWYTNKLLTVVFAMQLVGMAGTSVFSFNSFSVLYCVCYNKKMYQNVSLSLNCAVDFFLYLSGSTILLLSTMTVFEYGSYYFHEKFKVVQRHHHPESYVKQTIVSSNGCQGYISHSCAMVALSLLAICKAPLLFELVSLMRISDDQLLLSGVVCEVCYMVLWVALWFGLTIKQQWLFRILDYVSLRQPFYTLPGDNIITYSEGEHEDLPHIDNYGKGKRITGRDFTEGYLDPKLAGTNGSDEQCISDIGTDESDGFNIINCGSEILLDLDGNPVSEMIPGNKRARIRRNGGQRVTFDESARKMASMDKESHGPTSSLTRQGTVGGSRADDPNHFNVTAHVHNITPTSTNSSNESSQDVGVYRENAGTLDNKDYRNSIRNKCGEYYSSANNLVSKCENAPMVTNHSESPPTLMSSFRDKVRESSLAASAFKELERNMMTQFDYLDPLPPPIVESLDNKGDVQSQYVIMADGDIGEQSCYLQSCSTSSIGDNIGDGNRECDYCSSGNSRDRLLSNADCAHFKQIGSDTKYRCDIMKNSEYEYDMGDKSSLTQKKGDNLIYIDDKHMRGSAALTTLSPDLEIASVLGNWEQGGLRNNDSGGVHLDSDAYHSSRHLHPQQNMVGIRLKSTPQHPLAKAWHVHVVEGSKLETGRRDSANYSLTSSNESDNSQSLCSHV